MFTKKKQSLPARVTIPSTDEILADLRESQDDDVVFKPLSKVLASQESDLSKKFQEDVDNIKISFGELTADEALEPSTAYKLAKSFLHKCNSLEKGLKDIEDSRETLSSMKLSLEEDIKNVKEALVEKRTLIKD